MARLRPDSAPIRPESTQLGLAGSTDPQADAALVQAAELDLMALHFVRVLSLFSLLLIVVSITLMALWIWLVAAFAEANRKNDGRECEAQRGGGASLGLRVPALHLVKTRSGTRAVRLLRMRADVGPSWAPSQVEARAGLGACAYRRGLRWALSVHVQSGSVCQSGPTLTTPLLTALLATIPGRAASGFGTTLLGGALLAP